MICFRIRRDRLPAQRPRGRAPVAAAPGYTAGWLALALACSPAVEGSGGSGELPPAFTGNSGVSNAGVSNAGVSNAGTGNSGTSGTGANAVGASGAAAGSGETAAGSSAGGTSSEAPASGEGTPLDSEQNGAGGSAGAGQGAGAAGSAMVDDSPASDDPGAGGASMGGGGGDAAQEPFAGRGCAADVALFCEDFESLGVGAVQPRNGWRPEGTLSIDDQVARGTRALHLSPNGGQPARIFLDQFSAPNNSFFGRMYAFVEAFATGPNYAHFVMVEVTGNGGERLRPLGGQFIQEVGGLSMWGVGSDGGATGDWTAWQQTAPTENGTWTCLEWEMRAADNAVDVWIDGVAKPELSVSTNDHTGNGNLIFPSFTSAWFGWWVFQGGTTPPQFNVWLDDIVLSTERVGCD